MSKLTKLIKHPFMFFKDLRLLHGINKFKNQKTYKNMFVISNLSQLNIIKNIIKYENIENIVLVILYTNANKKMPQIVFDEAKKDNFNEIILFLLPNSPTRLKLASYIIMNKDFKKLINIYKPKHLYMLSFEAHYNVLANIAKNNNAELILIDEGTGTYKDKKDLDLSIAKKIIWQFFKLDDAFKWANNFSKIYALAPEILKDNFNADEYIKFSPHLNRFDDIDNTTLSLIQKYNITSNDIIYTNQRYIIEAYDFADALIYILDTISKNLNSKIFIKMHPKDHNSTIKIFEEKLSDFENLILILENTFLIEQSIRYIHPKAVISLTSTTLVTTTIISKNIKCYSIADWFCTLVPKTERNLIGINQILDHKEILYKFNNINFIQDEKFEFNQQKNLNKEENNQALYIQNFKTSYDEHKYYKAILNFQLAYDDILSASLDEIVSFLHCLDMQNGIKSINIFLDILTNTIIQTSDNNIISSQQYKILKKLFEIAIRHIELGHIKDSFVLLDNIFMFFTLFENQLENNKSNLICALYKTDKELHKSVMQFYLKCEEKLISIYNKQKYIQFCDVLDKNKILLDGELLDKYIDAAAKTKQYLKIKNLVDKIKINENNINIIINTYYNLSDIQGVKNILQKYDNMINLNNFEVLDMISKIYELSGDYEKALKYIEMAIHSNTSKLTNSLRMRKFYILQFIKFETNN
ncbi:alpha-2,8-polysialyltransferase [Campylobacter vicugnae]|uniref:Alpha-2,8-polysialyltransferase n=1 Tax=Campylobacter vicugnae TaxID=1660076 RepID=A0A1X9SZS1_9BACT|nr:alpha-2,8-polysialyltransferase family protein [Campylobacter sp. RM8964]ARR01609.1 alpha-2,8-polysialyltransferase [Campylobacter sp. RM8964]